MRSRCRPPTTEELNQQQEPLAAGSSFGFLAAIARPGEGSKPLPLLHSQAAEAMTARADSVWRLDTQADAGCRPVGQAKRTATLDLALQSQRNHHNPGRPSRVRHSRLARRCLGEEWHVSHTTSSVDNQYVR